jgi:hypothetical protein
VRHQSCGSVDLVRTIYLGDAACHASRSTKFRCHQLLALDGAERPARSNPEPCLICESRTKVSLRKIPSIGAATALHCHVPIFRSKEPLQTTCRNTRPLNLADTRVLSRCSRDVFTWHHLTLVEFEQITFSANAKLRPWLQVRKGKCRGPAGLSQGEKFVRTEIVSWHQP